MIGHQAIRVNCISTGLLILLQKGQKTFVIFMVFKDLLSVYPTEQYVINPGATPFSLRSRHFPSPYSSYHDHIVVSAQRTVPCVPGSIISDHCSALNAPVAFTDTFRQLMNIRCRFKGALPQFSHFAVLRQRLLLSIGTLIQYCRQINGPALYLGKEKREHLVLNLIDLAFV